MIATDSLPGRTIAVDSQEFLYFSGTSYLGVARQVEFQQHLQEGFARYGSNYSSSRISNVQLSVFEEIEHALATYTGAEAALTFASGFLAGQALVRQLQTEGVFHYAPRTHPALWLHTNDNIPEKHYPQWVQNLPDWLEKMPAEHIVLLANSLDPLYAEKYGFDWVQQLPDHKRFTLVVDDSHGLGVTGENGGGIFGQIHTPPHVELMVTSSLGKALGLPGGVVLGSRKRIEQLKKSPFFTAGSPMVPAYAHAFLQAGDLYAKLRKKLFQNSIFFKAQTSGSGLFQSFDDYPVFYTTTNELYTHLYENQILISSFPYPSPQHPPITRLIVSALHTQEDISAVADCIKTFAKQA